MGQRLEPMLVKAFVPKFAVEALNVGVLCRLAWLDQLQLYALSIGPFVESFVSELWDLVCTDCRRVTTEASRLIQDAGYALPGNPEIHHQVNCLLGAVIDDRQYLEPPPAGERIHHEIHRPDFVALGR